MNPQVRAIGVVGLLLIATVSAYGYAADGDLVEPAAAQNCDPNYLPCIPNTVGNALNCGDIQVAIRVIGVDHNVFDTDGDGTGCESYGIPPAAPPPPTVPTTSPPTTTTTVPSLPPQPAAGCPSLLSVSGTGLFVPISPARILDTRTGPQYVGALRAGDAISVQVAGCAGIPAGAGGAVAMNVTSTQASAASFITVWPTGEGRPNASALNTDPGQDTPNLVIAKLGTNGQVSMFNNNGTGHLIADVVGWLPPTGGYVALSPARLLDTRDGIGAPRTPLLQQSSVDLQVTLRGGVPGTGTDAVVLNVTSTQSSTPSFITVWPTGEGRPNASSLNTSPGQDTPNLVISKVGATNGQVSFFNNNGTGHLIADVVGYFPTGSGYVAVSPIRVSDTRSTLSRQPLAAGGVQTIVPLSVVPNPPAGASAVVLNVTSTEATGASFVTVWPTGEGRPNASSLNTDPGQDTPNLVIAKLGSNGQVSLYNNSSTTHLVVDIVGYFP